MRLVAGSLAGIIAAGAIGIAVAPSSAQTPAPSGAQAFAACRACHTLNKGGRSGLGPNLSGLFGRQAGSVAGFNYTPALKGSKLTWNEATLNQYLANPSKKVPGTRMPVTVPDPAKRTALIDYLKVETAK